jgi:hypothetical protein
VGRTSSLAVARDNNEGYFQPGTALHRLVLEAPYLARCSDNKTAARVRPVEYAIRYPYIQANRPGRVSWLIFDLDHPERQRADPWCWSDAGLPPPNLIVMNRESGRAHLYYAVAPVCTTEKARAKPIAYMRAVYEAMAARLDADPAYRQGSIAKTPGHPWWLTTELHPHEYSLGELAEYVDLAEPSPWAKGPRLEEAAGSRHCTLFELARYYAYSIVNREREKGTYEGFLRLVEAFCLNHNQRVSNLAAKPAELLSWAQIQATAKSIARWTWEHYRGNRDGVHRGAMALDKALPLAERQRLAAERTHELRHKATESRIRSACRQLQAAGEALAQAAIARLAGVTRQTVAAYRHVLEEVINPAAVAVLRPISHGVDDVNYGAHQISAVFDPSADLNGAGGRGASRRVFCRKPSS